MKITIDTKEDSHEDIRKILALLSQMVNKEVPSSNVFENPTSSELPNLMSIFDSSSQTPQPAEPAIPEQPSQAQRMPKVELY